VAKNVFGGDLALRIQHLLDERQGLADALSLIEATFGQIGAALGVSRRGRKPGRPLALASSVMTSGAQPKRRRRGRRSFATTAEEFVLGFVKSNRNPTTQQINSAWKQEGRGHTADNTLTKLVKERKLKRTPLGKGIRGSRFAVA
jgi:hypothetical protein